MSDFYFTTLDQGEEIVFGVVTSTASSSSNVQIGGASIVDRNASSERKLGVTNRRVIVEQQGTPEATRIVANDQVQRVAVKHETFVGQPRLRITEISTTAGETMTLDMLLSGSDDEARIKQTFPRAEISVVEEQKGWFAGLLGKIGLG